MRWMTIFLFRVEMKFELAHVNVFFFFSSLSLSPHYRNFYFSFFISHKQCESHFHSLSTCGVYWTLLDVYYEPERVCVCVDKLKMKFLCCCWPPSGSVLRSQFSNKHFSLKIVNVKYFLVGDKIIQSNSKQ